MSRQAILKLYKDILRYGETLKFTNKGYFRHRIRVAFKNNKDLNDKTIIDFQLKKVDEFVRCTLHLYITIIYFIWSIMFTFLSMCQKTHNRICSSIIREEFLLLGGIINNHKNVPMRSKSFKHYLDYSNVPKLDEADLEEQFIRGWGPGGQATNKTNNAVMLKHKPTGLIVKCHKTRSLLENKKHAREIMITKLDNLMNKERSIEAQIRILEKREQARKEYKRKKLDEMKKAFQEREGLT